MDGERESRPFTIRELKEFNGKNGKPAYVAFKGQVYDVSGSRFWTEGGHLKRHLAGDDLTEHMINAPHREDVLAGFQVVGELSEEAFFKRQLVRRIEKLHPHPIVVHFSMAYAAVVSLLCIFYIATNRTCFEEASYYLLVLGFITTPAAGLSGLLTWKVTYEGRMTKTFFRKIVLTIILSVVITMCFILRTAYPDIMITKNILSYMYVALILALVPVTLMLGYYGGKIVYG